MGVRVCQYININDSHAKYNYLRYRKTAISIFHPSGYTRARKTKNHVRQNHPLPLLLPSK